jgi:hypothetical protein
MQNTTLLPRPGAHLIQTVPKLSQDDVVLSGGQFVHGEVLGEIDGIHTKLNADPEGTTAIEAVGICFSRVDATDQDQPGLAHTRLTAVSESHLVWPDGATEAQKAAWLDELAARHIIAR